MGLSIETESVGGRIPQLHIWAAVVFSGLFFHDVFLDCDSGVVWAGRGGFQKTEGAFCRCFVEIRRIGMERWKDRIKKCLAWRADQKTTAIVACTPASALHTLILFGAVVR